MREQLGSQVNGWMVLGVSRRGTRRGERANGGRGGGEPREQNYQHRIARKASETKSQPGTKRENNAKSLTRNVSHHVASVALLNATFGGIHPRGRRGTRGTVHLSVFRCLSHLASGSGGDGLLGLDRNSLRVRPQRGDAHGRAAGKEEKTERKKKGSS